MPGSCGLAKVTTTVGRRATPVAPSDGVIEQIKSDPPTPAPPQSPGATVEGAAVVVVVGGAVVVGPGVVGAVVGAMVVGPGVVDGAGDAVVVGTAVVGAGLAVVVVGVGVVDVGVSVVVVGTGASANRGMGVAGQNNRQPAGKTAAHKRRNNGDANNAYSS